MSPTLLVFSFLFLGLILVFRWLRPQEKTPWALILAGTLALAILGAFSVDAPNSRRLRVFIIDGSPSFNRGHESLKNSLIESCADLGPDDLCALVVFGQKAKVLIAPVTTPNFDPDSVDWAMPGGSHLESGVEAALALSNPGSSKELFLLSDGNQTDGSLLRASAHCRERGVKLYSFCPALPPVNDISLGPIIGPQALSEMSQAAFLFPVTNHMTKGVQGRLEVTVYSGQSQEVVWELGLDLNLVAKQSLARRIERRVKKAGLYRLEARLYPAFSGEQFDQNNKQSHWFTVGNSLKALVLSSKKSHAPQLLKNAGFQTLTVHPGPKILERFRVALVSAPELLIIDNLALNILEPLIEDIDQAVSHHGLGLLVFGGPRAFGPGNYAGSSFEKILPLLSDPPSDPAQALTLTMAVDSSGSMKGRYSDALEYGIEKSASLLRSKDQVRLTAFAETIRWRQESLGSSAFDQALLELRELEPNDGTDLSLALSTLLNDLIKAPSQNKKLGLLVTDAQANLNNEQRASLRKQAQKLSALSQKSGAQMVLLLIGEPESLTFLKSISKDLSVGKVKVKALNIRNAKDALKKAIEGSLARAREEVAFGEFALKLTEVGKSYLGSRPIDGVLTAYNRTKAKPHAQIYATASENNEVLLAVASYGSGKVAALTSSLSSWLNPLIQTESGREFLTALPSLVRSRINRSWTVTAKRYGSQLKVIARHPNPELAGTADARVFVSDSKRRSEHRLIPSEPGIQASELNISTEAQTVSLVVNQEQLAILRVPGTDIAEYQNFDAHLDQLSRASESSGARRLTAWPIRSQDLQNGIHEEAGSELSLGPLFAFILALTVLSIAAGVALSKSTLLNFFSNK